MDFTKNESQQIVAGLARDIFTQRCTSERQRALELAGDSFDPGLWTTLATSGLVVYGDAEGEDGLGLLDLVSVLIEGGRRVAAVPLHTHGPATILISEYADPEFGDALLGTAALGEELLTAGVAESGVALPVTPSTTVRPEGGGYIVTGEKVLVAGLRRAAAVLVTATGPDGPVVAVVPTDAPGVSVQPQRLSDGDLQGLLTLDGVSVSSDHVFAAGSAERLVDLLTVAACAWTAGLTSEAMNLTAAYARERQQFGRPIGSFQAVAHRLADAYIDTTAQDLTLWAAAWRLAEKRPAAAEIATAKWWAAEAAHRVAHSTIHIHGGVGVDLDGSVHRYFTAAKRFEFHLGGAHEHARRLGDLMAEGSLVTGMSVTA